MEIVPKYKNRRTKHGKLNYAASLEWDWVPLDLGFDSSMYHKKHWAVTEYQGPFGILSLSTGRYYALEKMPFRFSAGGGVEKTINEPFETDLIKYGICVQESLGPIRGRLGFGRLHLCTLRYHNFGPTMDGWYGVVEIRYDDQEWVPRQW